MELNEVFPDEKIIELNEVFLDEKKQVNDKIQKICLPVSIVKRKIYKNALRLCLVDKTKEYIIMSSSTEVIKYLNTLSYPFEIKVTDFEKLSAIDKKFSFWLSGINHAFTIDLTTININKNGTLYIFISDWDHFTINTKYVPYLAEYFNNINK